jgi:hypothetical protein
MQLERVCLVGCSAVSSCSAARKPSRSYVRAGEERAVLRDGGGRVRTAKAPWNSTRAALQPRRRRLTSSAPGAAQARATRS